MSRVRPLLERLSLIMVIWLALVFVALLTFAVPRSAAGWLVLLFVGPPVVLLVEGLVEGLMYCAGRSSFYKTFDRWLSRRTAGKRVSVLRIGIALIGVVAFGGVLALLGIGAVELAEHWEPLATALSATGEFIETNYRP